MSRRAAVGVGTLLAVGAVGGVIAVAGTGVASADGGSQRATIRDASGAQLGTVAFVHRNDVTEVRVRLQLDPAAVATDAYHGFHIHANGDPANGEGCRADPSQEPSTWFTSADGHWNAGGEEHPGHRGDLTSLYVTPSGLVDARFTTARIDRSQLDGRAVVVHALPDNFANVPMGTAPNQYSANGAEALTATKGTGNAGARIACGVVGAA